MSAVVVEIVRHATCVGCGRTERIIRATGGNRPRKLAVFVCSSCDAAADWVER